MDLCKIYNGHLLHTTIKNNKLSVHVTFNMAKNERLKTCNFHTGLLLSGVSGAL